MTRERIEENLGAAFERLPESAAPGRTIYRGKVRDVVMGADRLLLVASDRLSAFDRILAVVPFKGEVLSRTAAYWFKKTEDIIPNHLVAGPGDLAGTGRVCLVKRAQMLPLEVVVRGYLTGSAWRDYKANKPISGIRLPEGLSFNEKFPVPLITPSTKEASGHDRAVSREELIAQGIVPEDLWRAVESASLALFRRGQELAQAVGLILVDTKYEFGIIDGELCLCDEIHTPDSSRYWWAQSYQSRYDAGEDQKELDKEPFRRWLAEHGFTGEGSAPAIPSAILAETSWRYIQAYETITGEFFEPATLSPQSELDAIARIVKERLGPDR
jgi:phosphoribosylaminoimidazole-succinocarboxamide synthase